MRVLRLLDWLVARALGVLFVLAAAWKPSDLREFEGTIARFGIVFDTLVPVTALGLIAAELLVGLGLVLGVRGALHGALGLALVFLGVLAYGLWLGLDLDCGCFGPGERTSLVQAFRRDLVLLALIGYLYRRRSWERKETRA